ncbi:hypothetical protein HJ588_02510 [Flexivirga sp. ID2601S]|uniref:DUF2029 domain-containing protein n=1 Tax=Flexivirga aerilata TaxID=1656889 RepID=A0A849AC98_9MICO|nr:hypothetical protein [Flexivirga aerilata]
MEHPWLAGIGVFVPIRAIGLFWLAYVGHRQNKDVRDMLSAWDGEWMLALAQHGYDGVPQRLVDAHGMHSADTAYAFFPGYPMLVRAVAVLPGVSVYAAAILTSVVAGAVATVAAYRIGEWCMLRARPDDAGMARRVGLLAAVLFAAAPMSIVLTMAYTEALYCALAGWALVMVLEKRWIAAGLLTIAAGLTRTTVVALIAVVVLAALLHWRDGWRPWAGIVLAPLGWLAWLVVVAVHAGSPLAWFRIQSDGWDTGFDAGQATWHYLRETLATNNSAGDVFTAWVILATLVLVVLAFVTRLPWQVSVYGALVVATVLLTDGLMNSRVRLLLPAYVLLVPVAIGLAHRSRTTQVTVGVAATAVSAWFGAYMLGVYPYAI